LSARPWRFKSRQQKNNKKTQIVKGEEVMKKLMIICLAVLVIVASVHAEAISMSGAGIDWTSLNITGNITWDSQNSYSYAYATDDTGWADDYQNEPGWVDTDAFASIGNSYGDAYTDDYDLNEYVRAIANEATTTQAYSNADAYRGGYFTATSDGWVKFSADYELWQRLYTDYVGEGAYGYAEAGLWLTNNTTYEWGEDMPVLENSVSDGGLINDEDAGTLMVEVWFDAGNSGNFQAWVYNDASAQIPEPATLSLLGLGALSLINRKNNNKKINK
jgi:hypothetical protein